MNEQDPISGQHRLPLTDWGDVDDRYSALLNKLSGVTELSEGRVSSSIASGVRHGSMLLRSANVKSNRGYTEVPARRLLIRYALAEGGLWQYVEVWPNVYLEAIRTGRLGSLSFAAVQIVQDDGIWRLQRQDKLPICWVFNRVLQRLYYSPWRY